MTVGLLGPSGAGKSTLLALAPRLYDVPEGRARSSSTATTSATSAWPTCAARSRWCRSRRSSSRGRSARTCCTPPPTRPPRSIREVLEAADFAATVDALPEGLETPVGERGQTLSGGQRQRLALARALLADPAILLLDDCTSALDSETEARVRAALADLRPGRTSLIVSHKVASVRHADLIVVLEGGRIVDQGTHAGLLGRGGHYAEVYAQQTRVLVS